MKINVAICDDEIKICSQVEGMIIKILNEMSMRYEVDVFNSGESLCKEMERTNYDLVFLDIELPEMSGVEIGEYIRNMLQNDIVQIAYISSKTEYALQLFEFRPINFLVKPLDENKVRGIFESYFRINGKEAYIFKYKKGYEYYKIETYKIRYFERNSRKVIMHTTEGEEDFYDSLELIYENLKGQGFLFIHKTYMINYRYIKIMGYDRVIMTDDIELPISQSRRAEIRKMYMNMEEE